MFMQAFYRMPKYFELIMRPHVNLEREITFLDSVLRKRKARTVLDVACGVGRHSAALAKIGYDTTGVDYSKHQIAFARKKAKREGIRSKFFVQNANELSLNKKFDAAICMWSTLCEEPMDYSVVLRRVYEHLKKGGVFIFDIRFLENKKKDHFFKKTFTNGKDKLSAYIHTRYTQNFRIQNIVFTVNGKKIPDVAVHYILTRGEWKRELKKAGFRNVEIFYDYKKRKLKKPDRIQFVAIK